MNFKQPFQGRIGIEVHFNPIWFRGFQAAETWTLKSKMALISDASQETVGESSFDQQGEGPHNCRDTAKAC